MEELTREQKVCFELTREQKVRFELTREQKVRLKTYLRNLKDYNPSPPFLALIGDCDENNNE